MTPALFVNGVRVGAYSVGGYSGDGGQATDAALNAPSAIAVDAAGNVFIADSGNFRIREVSAATQVITTVAGNGARSYTRRWSTGHRRHAFAPGRDRHRCRRRPFIADQGNDVIREVNAVTHIMTTVAGNGTSGSGGDGGLATDAELPEMFQIAVDAAGNIFIADDGGSRIREVNAITHIITTIVGNGSVSYSGDGGMATAAGLEYPVGYRGGRGRRLVHRRSEPRCGPRGERRHAYHHHGRRKRQ